MFEHFEPYAAEVYHFNERVFAVVRRAASGALNVTVYTPGGQTLSAVYSPSLPSHRRYKYIEGDPKVDDGSRATAWVAEYGGGHSDALDTLLRQTAYRLEHVASGADDVKIKERIDNEIRSMVPEV